MKPARIKRHKRIRKKVFGTKERPRLSIYRSLKNIYVQFIDDDSNTTLLTCSTLDKELKLSRTGGNVKAATLLGAVVAQKAKAKGINKVVFDRGGCLYHGRVKAIAEAARKEGLVF